MGEAPDIVSIIIFHVPDINKRRKRFYLHTDKKKYGFMIHDVGFENIETGDGRYCSVHS